MMRPLHEAARRLRPYQRSAAVIGCSRLLLHLIKLPVSLWIQQFLRSSGYFQGSVASVQLNGSDLFLAGTLLAALLACTPLRMQTAWQIGRLSGTLDDNDLGFLAHSGAFWLWCRAIGTRLLMQLLILLSAMPALLLGFTAKCIWLTIPPESEGLLPLLTVLHLGLLAAAAILLPVRCAAASAALPFCFLKAPHEPAFRILRTAFRDTRGQTSGILLNRLIVMPLLLLPFTAVRMIPILLTAEQLRCMTVRRHLIPAPRSRFSGLELHAYDSPAL